MNCCCPSWMKPSLPTARSTFSSFWAISRAGDGLDAAKADFRLGTHQYRQVERAAFVGQGKGQKRLIKIMDPFTRHTEERFFEHDQLEEAWNWAKGD